MDKYEFNIKVEQIKKLINRGDYATAMKIADTIDWHRVRNASLLSMIAQIYEKNEEYQEAKDILLIAFERAPIGKRLLYKLTELALKEGSVEEATTYYKEFCELAQEDPRQYLLRYMILKEKKAPIEQLIRALERYTSSEVDEKWMYELAELYHKAGMEEKCVATCDTIMLLFGLGKYVDKAMDLKLEYAPLNKYQMDLVENRDKYEAKLRAVEEEYGSRAGRVKAEPVIEEEEIVETEAETDTEMDVEVEVAVDDSVVIKLHEDEQTEMLAQEMAKLAEEEAPTAIVEEDDMEATRALDDLRSLKEIKPTQRVLDAAAERAAEEAAETEREIARQRAAIRAAKEREEMEAEALRRAEEEREAARREEAERRARRQAEIDRERAEAEAKAAAEAAAAEAEVEELDLEDAEEETSKEMYNLMIEAETEEEGLAMALEALKKIHKELGSKNPVAKINSEKLNKKGILAVADKLKGKDLVIEQAAGLALAVQNELDELMEHDDSGMIVVLIDTPENLEKLHATHASLASKFQYIGADEAEKAAPVAETPSDKVIRIRPEAEETRKEDEANAKVQESEPAETDAESDDTYEEEAEEAYQSDSEEESDDDYDDENEMDPDEFAQYACKYASEIDCSIVDKSLLALYERIEMMEEDGVRLTKKAAVDLIEEAADKAEKQSFGRKLMSLFSPMYDKEGYLILREKDFFD